MGNIIFCSLLFHVSNGASNSEEGAAIEYAVGGLGIKDIVICGHSHCGAMKGLLQIGNLTQQMPLVYDWLKNHAESTRRLVLDNYESSSSEKLLKIAIEQNVLTQIENLETYLIIRSKLHGGQLTLHAWIYEIETGGVSLTMLASVNLNMSENRPFPVLNPMICSHT